MRLTSGSIATKAAFLLLKRLNSRLDLSVRLTDAPPVSARWPDSTALVVSSAVCLVLISSVTVFSPFLPLFSRGTKRRVGPARQAKGCLFAGEPRNFALRFVSWGDRKPGGCRRSDKAEARRAASAQGLSPSRRARENKGRQKRSVTEVRKAGADGSNSGLHSAPVSSMLPVTI